MSNVSIRNVFRTLSFCDRMDDILLRVHSEDLHDHVAQEVGECLESGLYTDLMVRCKDGEALHAHKLVLSAASPFLRMVSP